MKIFKNDKYRSLIIKSYNKLLKNWNVQYRERNINTSFGQTHTITVGKPYNPPLLLFHGVGDNSAVMWIRNIEELSKSFYCICIDTIGGPGKSIPNQNYNRDSFDQIKWIDEVADNLGIDKFHLVGVSNGACITYNYLSKRGERIYRAICIEGGMIVENPLKSMMKTLMLMFPYILLPTTSNMRKILKRLSSPHSNFMEIQNDVIDHIILTMKGHNQQAMFVHKLYPYDPERGQKIKDRVLFIVGDHNIDNKKSFINLLKSDQFIYKVVKNAGHGVNHEQPKAVNREIVEYLLQY